MSIDGSLRDPSIHHNDISVASRSTRSLPLAVTFVMDIWIKSKITRDLNM
jgi:hypothetical protein